MDQVIEPMTGELNTADLMPQEAGETIRNALPPDAQRYTFDNGEYVPKLDILYPPETVFFVMDADGKFVPEGNAGLEATNPAPLSEETPAPMEITLEQMTSTAVAFLEKQGFVVRHVSDMPKTSDKIEKAVLLSKIQSLVSGHMTTHAAINETTTLISKLNELL